MRSTKQVQVLCALVTALIACPPAGIKSPPHKRSAPTTCPAGQIRRCLGDCVVPQQSGQLCNPNECAFGALICAPGLACASGPGANDPFRCYPPLPPANASNVAPGSPQACDPLVDANRISFNRFQLTSNACINNTICMRTFPNTSGGGCLRIDTAADGTTNPRQGACIAPAVDGEVCDTDDATARLSRGVTTVGGATSLSCRPCAAGLSCLNGRCRRPCLDPQSPGAGTLTLSACPLDSTLRVNGSANQFQCSAIFTSDAIANQYSLVPSTPNTVCTSCTPRGQNCTIGDRFSAQDVTRTPVQLPIIPPRLGFPPTMWTTSVLSSPLSRATPVPGTSTTVSVTGVTGPVFVASDVCCNPSDICMDSRCCVAPSAPCASDAQCCPFSMERVGREVRPRSGICMSVRTNRGRDLINSAVFDAFASVQASGCLNPNCGGLGQACCPAVFGISQCNAGLGCDTRNNTCQIPCDGCRRCSAGGSATGFVEPCAGPGNGFCSPRPASGCGAPGQPCCPRTAASDGCNRASATPSQCYATERRPTCPAEQESWRCEGCGLPGQPCCRDAAGNANQCLLGGLCWEAAPGGPTCTASTCGAVGQPCCSFGDSISCQGAPSQVACISGSCRNCGGVGQPCCGQVGHPASCRPTATANLACASTTIGNQCVACGAAGQPCCVSFDPSGSSFVESCNASMTCQTAGSGARVCAP
jgi:hypothetical protein